MTPYVKISAAKLIKIDGTSINSFVINKIYDYRRV